MVRRVVGFRAAALALVWAALGGTTGCAADGCADDLLFARTGAADRCRPRGGPDLSAVDADVAPLSDADAPDVGPAADVDAGESLLPADADAHDAAADGLAETTDVPLDADIGPLTTPAGSVVFEQNGGGHYRDNTLHRAFLDGRRAAEDLKAAFVAKGADPTVDGARLAVDPGGRWFLVSTVNEGLAIVDVALAGPVIPTGVGVWDVDEAPGATVSADAERVTVAYAVAADALRATTSPFNVLVRRGTGEWAPIALEAVLAACSGIVESDRGARPQLSADGDRLALVLTTSLSADRTAGLGVGFAVIRGLAGGLLTCRATHDVRLDVGTAESLDFVTFPPSVGEAGILFTADNGLYQGVWMEDDGSWYVTASLVRPPEADVEYRMPCVTGRGHVVVAGIADDDSAPYFIRVLARGGADGTQLTSAGATDVNLAGVWPGAGWALWSPTGLACGD